MNAEKLKDKIRNLERELKSTKLQLEAISQPVLNKTPIKHKRKYGVVTGFHVGNNGEQFVEFVYHNGMKPSHTFAPLEEIKIVSNDSMEDFNRHIRQNGSLLKYLE